MGLYDRDYTQQDYRRRYPSAPQMHFGLPRMTKAVKILLTVNIGLFLLNVILTPTDGSLSIIDRFLTVNPTSLFRALQVWRLVTYQFIHWGLWHILVNMLGLYFLGPVLERHWGTKRFTIFYLSCGAVGGLFYMLLVAVGFLKAGPMAGASGAVLGLLAACAILFPQFIVFLLFIPIPIRVAAVIVIFIATATILARGANAGGEAAHLAGIFAGGAYVLTEKWRTNLKLRLKAGRWERNIEQERKLRIEVDRILKKVHDHGIQSLSPAEKRALKKATRLEQSRTHP
ncbi:MAG: rhomboid family intramembrane serine protease [Sedimentisphaerales bacterium]|nr:rhomboid family intramembrane serine protease [Sedimentisphaerales bacterium]